MIEAYFDPPRAKELGPGVTLLTIDGSRIGNAIIIKEVKKTVSVVGTGQRVWLVETDFGNRLHTTDAEIHSLWNIGFQQNYDQWFDDRLELHRRAIEEDGGA